MAKKLILVWLTLLMVLFSSISIYADENVQGDFFVKHVVVNGTEIVNYNLQYPFFLYLNTLYIPLTEEIGEICGFKAIVDWDSHTLKLLKTDSTKTNISSNWMKNNNNVTDAVAIQNSSVMALNKDACDEINGSFGTLSTFGEVLTLEETNPLLQVGKYAYVPLRTFSGGETFDWDIYFDPYYGVCISTDPSIPASSYCDKEEVVHNKGLVSYMRNYNSSLSASVAQNFLFFFKRAAKVYDIDEQLLMAIAHKESNFNYASGSGRRPIGLMQILPSTAERYGLSVEDLYNPYKNICFGAMYVSERIKAYNGNWTLGLSAYNQGSAKVNRGSYSTAYATRVISAYNAIDTYLEKNGFVYFEPTSVSTSIEAVGSN